MKLHGKLYWADGVDEDSRITEAVITRSRISIDWLEDEDTGHLDAISEDGVHFSGTYGYPRPNPKCTFSLTKYESQGGVLLFGTWHDRATGDEGIWVFELAKDASMGKRVSVVAGR